MPKLAIAHSETGIVRLAGLCRNASLMLVACLPFLIPFNAARNIDLQGLLLIVSGSLAWLAVLLYYHRTFKRLDRLSLTLLSVFSICCLISSLVNPHYGYDFFGAPYIRLGTAGLLSCIGIGVLVRTMDYKRLVTGLYAIILGLSTVSVPYSWLHFHSLLRMGGVFAQADILACFLGCGLLLGLEMLSLYPRQRRTWLSIQLLLASFLLLTQTRAVLFLLTVILVFWVFQHHQRKMFGPLVLFAFTVFAFSILSYFAPSRLTDTSYASQSFNYRLTLQGYALKASEQKPLLGYGPGNLADALSCSRLPAKPLQATCHQGYFFNSSHNIFIDRVLAVGWLGGLAFLGVVVLAIYRSFRGNKEARILGYLIILISCYYLTNVTGVTLELVLWILLLQCLAVKPKGKKQLR